MNDDSDKLNTYALCYVMKFTGENADDVSKRVELEQTEITDSEVELGFSLGRSRYYLRVRKDDIARLCELEAGRG